MLAAGHEVTLYSYGVVENVPDGVRMADGRDILPLDRLLIHRKTKSYALGSNIFRYLIQQQGLGLWLDTDVLCLRPIELDSDYLFGLVSDGLLNGAVLYLRQGSELLKDLLRYCASRPLVPPWWPLKRRAGQYLKGLAGRALVPEDMEWGVLGPNALTWFVRRRGLEPAARARDVFYPVHYSDAELAFGPESEMARHISGRTLTLHLWNEMIKTRKCEPPPEGSYIEKMCRRLDVPLP